MGIFDQRPPQPPVTQEAAIEKPKDDLPELRQGQGVYYLKRDGDQYEIASGVYMGAINSSTKGDRAVIAHEHTPNPAKFLSDYQRQVTIQEGGAVMLRSGKAGMDDVNDSVVLKQAISARLGDTQRLNPSRERITQSFIESVQTAEAYAKGRMQNLLFPIERMRPVAQDMKKGLLTTQSHDFYALRKQTEVERLLEGCDLEPKKDQLAPWQYAVESLRRIEQRIETVERERQQKIGELERQVRVFQESARKRPLDIYEQLDYEVLQGGVQRLREHPELFTQKLTSARERVANILGELLTAAVWAQATQQGKK